MKGKSGSFVRSSRDHNNVKGQVPEMIGSKLSFACSTFRCLACLIDIEPRTVTGEA